MERKRTPKADGQAALIAERLEKAQTASDPAAMTKGQGREPADGSALERVVARSTGDGRPIRSGEGSANGRSEEARAEGDRDAGEKIRETARQKLARITGEETLPVAIEDVPDRIGTRSPKRADGSDYFPKRRKTIGPTRDRPDGLSYEERKRLQKMTKVWLNGLQFVWWVTIQPNADATRHGQKLKTVWPKFVVCASGNAFGRRAAHQKEDNLCFQGIVFFEGGISDHAHAFIWSGIQTSELETKRAFDCTTETFFTKGTADVQVLTDESREKRFSYVSKELCKPGRLESYQIFGPHPDVQTLSIPQFGEPFEYQWRGRFFKEPEPDLATYSDKELKLILLKARAYGCRFKECLLTMTRQELLTKAEKLCQPNTFVGGDK